MLNNYRNTVAECGHNDVFQAESSLDAADQLTETFMARATEEDDENREERIGPAG